MIERFYKLPKAIAADRRLTSTAKVLYAVIADGIGNNAFCWPGVRTLARDCGACTETVIQAVLALEAAGLIKVERRKSGQSNRYSVALASALGTSALPDGSTRPKRPRNPHHGVQRARTQAHGKAGLNQTDLLNQTVRRAADKPPPDPRVKEFINWFCQMFQEAQNRAYIVTGGKDGKLIKGLLRTLDRNGADGLARLKQATQTLLADPWGHDNASIGLLASQINKWLAAGGPIPALAPTRVERDNWGKITADAAAGQVREAGR